MNKLLYLLLILLATSAYSQNRRVDTLFTKKMIRFDSLAAQSPSEWGYGGLYSRGNLGLFYTNGGAVTRLDSGFAGGGGGITSLNSLTGASQTFVNDTNVTITSTSSIHSLGWTGTLATNRGGTGVSALSSVSGTSNQVTVTGSGKVIGGTLTLSLPQNIDSTSNLALGRLTFPLGTEFLQWKNYGAGAGILIYPTTTPTSQLVMKLPTSGGTFVTNANSPLAISTAGTVYLDGLGGMFANRVIGSNASANGVEYKQFSAGTNMSIVHTPGVVTFGLTGAVAVANGGIALTSLPSANRILTVNTVGTAYIGKVVVGAGATSISNSNDTLTITTSAASGEANTASNIAGAGIGIFGTKTAVDLPFKRLKNNVTSTITDMTDSVLIASDTSYMATQYDIPVPVTSYIRSGIDSLAVTVSSVSKAMGSYADSRAVPPIPLKVTVKNATTVVLKVEYATPYDSLRVDWMYWR